MIRILPTAARLDLYRREAAKADPAKPWDWRHFARLHNAARYGKPGPLGHWQNPETVERGASRAFYVDSLDSLPWRNLGRADKVSDSIRHTGWHTHPQGDTGSLAGYVLQLPARNGKPVYIPATSHTEYDGDTVYPLEQFESPRDAAIRADRYAEIEAEKERDYQESWQLGADYAAAREEALQARDRRRILERRLREAESLIAAWRATVARPGRRPCALAPATIQMARDFAASLRRDIRAERQEGKEAHERAESILSDNPYRIADAFAEGAGSYNPAD